MTREYLGQLIHLGIEGSVLTPVRQQACLSRVNPRVEVGSAANPLAFLYEIGRDPPEPKPMRGGNYDRAKRQDCF